ncbi:MAG TPA: hemolysin family protein [Smithellaceae bacterium]|nr:hemolysin family protein [Smithellaceae bacterium]
MLDKIIRLIFRHDQEYYKNKIRHALKIAQEKEAIDSSACEMIENIMEFRNIVVREVMVPRTAIIAISTEETIEKIIADLAESGHTRIPVYRDSIDNIIGILNVKDLLKFWSRQMTRENIWGCLRKPYYIPETKNIHSLFYELKEKKYHMAIVIDEYGGTSGLVSFEDLLEEIVGEIDDEYDVETGTEGILKSADGSVIIEGRMEIEKVEDFLNVNFEKGHYETIGGLILHKIKRIPLPGEKLQMQGMELTIEKADERTIKKVRVKILKNDEKDREIVN